MPDNYYFTFLVNQIEEEELEEFELLEQAAANESFSSNSSVVVRVLAKARGNVVGGKLMSRGHGVINKKGKHWVLVITPIVDI